MPCGIVNGEVIETVFDGGGGGVTAETTSENDCDTAPAELLAVKVTGNVPEAVGVPLKTGEEKVTPSGMAPLSAIFGAGVPVTVTVKLPGIP